MKRIIQFVLPTLMASGCAQPSEDGCPEGRIWDALAASCRMLLPDRSKEGSSWEEGRVAFREATREWGLDVLGVEGTRLSVADVDGDGWPDLSVRRTGSVGDDFAGTRTTWLLRNVEGKRFEDITLRSGLVQRREGAEPNLGRPAEVIVWADVNNDGAVDAFTGVSTGPGDEFTSELMMNDGWGGFVLGPVDSPARLTGSHASVGAAVFLDVDRDGLVDLFVGHGVGPGGMPVGDRLLMNLGDGAFFDATERIGLATLPWTSLDDRDRALAHTNTWGATACDLDGDGHPELLVSSYGRAPNHLWRGGGVEGYENVSINSGYAFDHRMDWSDNESARCHCHLHPEDDECGAVPPPTVRCEDDGDVLRWNHASDRRPHRLGGNSATTICADLNGDGALDLLTTEIVHWDVGSSSDPSEILYNLGEGLTFSRPGSEATGLRRERSRLDWNDGDMTGAVFDFDNDGRPDIYIGSSDYPGTRGHLFWQRPDETFFPVPIAEGIDHRSSHGIAVADFDGDGDLDIALGHSRMRCEDQCYETATVRYFENLIGQDGNWVQLDLLGGEGTNRLAVGARVEVRTGDRHQVQEVGGGHGHYGIQHDRVLHFGLGEAKEAAVTVRWPDRNLSTQRFTLQAGHRYRVLQGHEPAPSK